MHTILLNFPKPLLVRHVKANLAFVDQAFVSGMNFLTGLALARFLGLEGYGEYVLVYGAILFSSTVQMSLILSPMMVKGAGIEGLSRRKYFSSVLFNSCCSVF